MGAGKKQFLEARIARAEEELLKLEMTEARFGTNSDYDQETILVWTQNRFSDGPTPRSRITYTFTAIKIGVYWYTSSQFNTKRTWDDLLENHLMLAEQVWYAKNLEEL